MQIVVCQTKTELGQRAAGQAAEVIRRALAAKGAASLVVATGASQFEVLAALVAAPDIEWSRVTGFHLDEYVGLPESHPASFRRYLRERFVERVAPSLAQFYYINGKDNAAAECRRLGSIISSYPIDVALVGIGENGHLAFNDPPADFETDEPYLVVQLDEACRRQQLGEGWFSTLDDVPKLAISMSIRQIMKSATIVCSVPDVRKAESVRAAVEGPVTPEVPASILQKHPAATLYLDRESEGLLHGVRAKQ